MCWKCAGYWGSGFGSFDYDGPDRRSWKEKSEAAKRRESSAKSIFHNQFLAEARNAKSFPFTMRDVVPASIHLTQSCFRDFKKDVAAHGCTATRREITSVEKSFLPSKDRRKGKMYAITISINAHPDTVTANIEEKKDKAEAARKKEEEMTALVAKDYAMIEQYLESNPIQSHKSDGKKSNPKKRALAEHDGNKTDTNSESSSSPKKAKALSSTKTITNLVITAPKQRLLAKAYSSYASQRLIIEAKIREDKRNEEIELLDELQKKWKTKENELFKEAIAKFDTITKIIEDTSSSVSLKSSSAASAKLVVSNSANIGQ